MVLVTLPNGEDHVCVSTTAQSDTHPAKNKNKNKKHTHTHTHTRTDTSVKKKQYSENSKGGPVSVRTSEPVAPPRSSSIPRVAPVWSGYKLLQALLPWEKVKAKHGSMFGAYTVDLISPPVISERGLVSSNGLG